jgi:hypothetical protein
MKNKKRLIFIALSILILIYSVMKNSFISNGDFNEWVVYILKIPFIYFLCGIFYPEIRIKHLLYIILTVIAMTFIDLIGGSFLLTIRELSGYLIGGGILLFILYVISKYLKKQDGHIRK